MPDQIKLLILKKLSIVKNKLMNIVLLIFKQKLYGKRSFTTSLYSRQINVLYLFCVKFYCLVII